MTDALIDPQDTTTTETPASGGSREARYRVERNEARAQAEALATQVEQLQTRELERIAAKHISNPADLLTLSGKTLADFIGVDGNLDLELVTATANELLGTRPGLRPNQPAYDQTQGHGSPNLPKPTPTWTAVLQG